MADIKHKDTVRVTQVRSPIGRPSDQRSTLIGLNLNKMHKTITIFEVYFLISRVTLPIAFRSLNILKAETKSCILKD